jgi:hypothetical protein
MEVVQKNSARGNPFFPTRGGAQYGWPDQEPLSSMVAERTPFEDCISVVELWNHVFQTLCLFFSHFHETPGY